MVHSEKDVIADKGHEPVKLWSVEMVYIFHCLYPDTVIVLYHSVIATMLKYNCKMLYSFIHILKLYTSHIIVYVQNCLSVTV